LPHARQARILGVQFATDEHPEPTTMQPLSANAEQSNLVGDPPLPAARRPGYSGVVLTTLVDRARLVDLARTWGSRGEPGSHVLSEPSLGTVVVFPPHRRARVWLVGVVETTGRAGCRVAYIHPTDLAHSDRPEIRRCRPHTFRAVPEPGSVWAP